MSPRFKTPDAALALMFVLLCGILTSSTATAQSATYSFTGTVTRGSFNSTTIPVGSAVTGTFSVNLSVATHTGGAKGNLILQQCVGICSYGTAPHNYPNGAMFNMSIVGEGFSYQSTMPTAADYNAATMIQENARTDIPGGLELQEHLNDMDNEGDVASAGSDIQLSGTPGCPSFLPDALPNLSCIGTAYGRVGYGARSNNAKRPPGGVESGNLNVAFAVTRISLCNKGDCTACNTSNDAVRSVAPCDQPTAYVHNPQVVVVDPKAEREKEIAAGIQAQKAVATRIQQQRQSRQDIMSTYRTCIASPPPAGQSRAEVQAACAAQMDAAYRSQTQ